MNKSEKASASIEKVSMKIDYTLLKNNLVYFAFIVLVIFFWMIAGSDFISVRNWSLILQQVAVLSVLAIGVTFVITAGYIDLSIGSVLGFSCLIGAMCVQQFGPIGFLGGVLAAIVLGMLNGALFAYLKVPSFIATLGTMVIIKALTVIISGGSAVYLYDSLSMGGNTSAWLQKMGSFPYVVIIVAFVIFITWLIYNKSVYGYDLKAMGGNEKVVQLFGVQINQYKVFTFGLTGLLVGLASIINLAQMGAATPVTGQGMELDAISAVVLGGTPLSGGYGSVVKTFIGALTLIVLADGLTIAGVPPSWNDVIRGALLITAVAVALQRKKIGIVK